MTRRVVLWNSREAKEKCEQFTKSYAQLRSDLLDHLEHKGHVALKYADDWDGFFLYCREKLKIELRPDTIRLQIATAQVSREVGVDVPMVITRHLAKLPPDRQKEVYDEVIGAREVAGQRSANQMEPDVRRVVRRELGVIEPPVPEAASITSKMDDVHEALQNDLGPGAQVYSIREPALIEPGVIDCVSINNTGVWSMGEDEATLGDGSVIRDVPKYVVGVDMVGSEPSVSVMAVQKDGDIVAILPLSETRFGGAMALLSRFAAAYQTQNQDEILAVYIETRRFLEAGWNE